MDAYPTWVRRDGYGLAAGGTCTWDQIDFECRVPDPTPGPVGAISMLSM